MINGLDDMVPKGHEWEPRTSKERKPGYTTVYALWDEEDENGNLIGGVIYMNDEDAIRYKKELKDKKQKQKRNILSSGMPSDF